MRDPIERREVLVVSSCVINERIGAARDVDDAQRHLGIRLAGERIALVFDAVVGREKIHDRKVRHTALVHREIGEPFAVRRPAKRVLDAELFGIDPVERRVKHVVRSATVCQPADRALWRECCNVKVGGV
jgi:hypothetical protein